MARYIRYAVRKHRKRKRKRLYVSRTYGVKSAKRRKKRGFLQSFVDEFEHGLKEGRARKKAAKEAKLKEKPTKVEAVKIKPKKPGLLRQFVGKGIEHLKRKRAENEAKYKAQEEYLRHRREREFPKAGLLARREEPKRIGRFISVPVFKKYQKEYKPLKDKSREEMIREDMI